MKYTKEGTAALRAEKTAERRQIKELNKPGDRLVWLRKQLRLTQKSVSIATGIPASTYNERELGVRSDYYEEQLVLSSFFDAEWQDRYMGGRYPIYEGKTVTRITPMWLMFGHYETYEEIEVATKGKKFI